MEKTINEISKNMEFHQKELAKNEKALKALQDICLHKKEYQVTNTSGIIIRKCTKCGKTFYE